MDFQPHPFSRLISRIFSTSCSRLMLDLTPTADAAPGRRAPDRGLRGRPSIVWRAGFPCQPRGAPNVRALAMAPARRRRFFSEISFPVVRNCAMLSAFGAGGPRVKRGEAREGKGTRKNGQVVGAGV